MWDNLCGEISSTEDATKVALNHEENCQLAFGTSRGQCFPLEIWNMVELLELPLLSVSYTHLTLPTNAEV